MGVLAIPRKPASRLGKQPAAFVQTDRFDADPGSSGKLVYGETPHRASVSLAEVDIVYSGFGVTNWDGAPFPQNHQFAFSTPPQIREDWRVFNLRLEFAIRAATLIAGYSFEDYNLDDWQQGGIGPWVEAVGAETLLRDTSRSHQWGNRLFNMGTYLSPGYNAHIGFLGVRYRF